MKRKATKASLGDGQQLAASDGLPRAILDVRLAILGQRVALDCQSEIRATAGRQI
jgi:hypothetical protein